MRSNREEDALYFSLDVLIDPRMNSKTFIPIQHSIAAKLLKVVFSIYLLFAITVTLIHMSAEYFNRKTHIQRDLEIFAKTFQPALAGAMYSFNTDHLNATLQGMREIPIIIGIKIENTEGDITGAVGVIRNRINEVVKITGQGDQKSVKAAGLFQHTFPIFYTFGEETSIIGKGTLYSSMEVVLESVQYGFIFIVINSILKTMALWIIFLWAARLLLSRPLATLTAAAEQLELEHVENSKVDINAQERNEFKVLEEAFNTMIYKLLKARQSSERAQQFLLEAQRKAYEEEQRSLKAQHLASVMETELKTAHTVQEFLIPKSDPQHELIDLSSFYQSATEAGGDWYDYQFLPECQQLHILIGDVTGHGVPAAIITAIANSFYHTLELYRKTQIETGQPTEHLHHPDFLLGLFNQLLYQTTQGEYLMSFLYAVIDFTTYELTFSNAGHVPGLIWRSSKFVTFKNNREVVQAFYPMMVNDHILGAFHKKTYRKKTQILHKDDVLVLYTDGLTENFNVEEDMFGLRHLRQIIAKSADLSADVIKERILQSAFAHYGDQPLADDITLIVGKIR